MKITIIITSLFCFFALNSTAQIEKAPPLNCNCNKLQTQAYLWIEGSNTSSFTNYIVEIQIPNSANNSLPAGLRCTAVADSIYFFTRVRGLAQDRYNSLSQFVNTFDKVSTDGKWRTLRYRIPKTLFNLVPVFRQPIGLFLKVKYGNKICTASFNTEIADEII